MCLLQGSLLDPLNRAPIEFEGPLNEGIDGIRHKFRHKYGG